MYIYSILYTIYYIIYYILYYMYIYICMYVYVYVYKVFKMKKHFKNISASCLNWFIYLKITFTILLIQFYSLM